MYNNPYDHFRQQNLSPLNQMDSMQDMGTQQPFYNQMPTMPMQPIQPMVPMGTVTGAMASPMGGVQEVPGTTSGAMPTTIGSIPIAPVSPIAPETLEGSPIMDVQYTQGWLTTQIGQRVKVEFLIGTNMFLDREGTLVDVGISYIIINEIETDDLLLCDIYSIKFVRIYR